MQINEKNSSKKIHGGMEYIMKNGIEIRWHGRGGQGAKTAALLLADVAFKTVRSVWEHRSQRTTGSAQM